MNQICIKHNQIYLMRNALSLLLFTICSTVFSVSAQLADESKTQYKALTSVQHNDSKNNSKFRFNETKLDAAGIEKEAQLIRLQFDNTKGIIRLQDTELIEDDAPAAGVPEGYGGYSNGPVEWVEDLNKGIVIKKIFEVENPSAVSARVVFKGMEVKDNKETLYLSLNGEKFERLASQFAFPQARQYIDLYWDQWYHIDIPIEKLRKGKNELLLWTKSDSTSWRILIAHEKEFKRGSLTRTSPNRSMKSSNGGGIWSDTRLGAKDLIDGEYAIRLSLDHFLPAGQYFSPLIDLVDGDLPIKHSSDNLKASIWTDIELPAQTSAKAFVRFGESPIIGDQSWTAWQPLERGHEYPLAKKRYLQWRAELTTADPLNTPQIRGIRINASWEDHSLNNNTGMQAKVINNGEIIPSSYPFAYENLNHLELKKFREDHKLDEVVKGAKSEFEVMMLLLNWAYRVPITQTDYSWNWNDVTVTPVISEGTGLPQLNGPFKDRRMSGMCLYPTQALIGAFLSMGYQARHININSEGMSGHEVTEVWSNELNKWVYVDPTIDTYYFNQETGIPYNLLEIHNLLAEQLPRTDDWKRPFVPEMGKEVVSRIKIGMRQGNNPFSILTAPSDNGGSWALETMGHFRIIPRNDFLTNPLPTPVAEGNTMWGWDGYLNWFDDIFPKRDEYQQYTNRANDFYQPLNQTKVYLLETEKSGVLKVVLDNFTPGGFDSFLVGINEGTWYTQNQSTLNWELQSGLNNIRVRSKNSRGILGPISNIQVTYNP